MKGALYCLLAVVMSTALSGCAEHYTEASYVDPYGFFSGILHGAVFPFALLIVAISWILSVIDISLFSDIQLVGRPNTGFLFYYIGYVIGLSFWVGGGAAQ
jgi:hypothetical protein